VKLKGGSLNIRKLDLSYETPVSAGENVTNIDKAKYEPDDVQYKNNGWLTTDDNYPRAVSFFNGRLVFAGTKKDPQRVFASAIKEADRCYNFTTYKRILTEKKDYTVLFGDIDVKDTSIIKANPQHIVNTFSKPQTKYFIDSDQYDKNTCIEYIDFLQIKLSRGIINPNLVIDIDPIKTDLTQKIETYKGFNENKEWVEVFRREWHAEYYLTWNNLGTQDYESWVKCRVRNSCIDIKSYARWRINQGRWEVRVGNLDYDSFQTRVITIPDEVKKIVEDDASSLTADLNSIIQLRISGVNESFLEIPDRITDNHGVKKQDLIDGCINTLYSHVRDTMYYKLETPKGSVIEYYDEPLNILTAIEGLAANINKTYIPFYTREIIKDEYPTPDCGFTFEIASDMNDSIRWLAVNKGLIIGTETAEGIVPPGVHATNIQASLNSRYGSDKIQGTAIGDATIFFQAGKKRLVEYYIPQADNNFRANDMAMLSSQMLDESPAVEFDFVSSPHTKLLVTREDGTMAALLYERSTGTFAWSRISLGQGLIRSAAVVPGPDGNDDVYLVVKRKSIFTLERLRERQGAGTVYLDCYDHIHNGNASWGWQNQIEKYMAEGEQPQLCCLKYNPNTYETFPIDPKPDMGSGDWYIGYPYTSVLRTMPVLSNDKMKKQRIVALIFRFLNSYLPKMTSLAAGRRIQTDTLTAAQPPFSGIYKQTFPGSWDEEVQAELTTDEAAPVKILSLNAERAGG
jgi:hypothetical protein